MNDEKINSMIQTPLTINQYFFEKNIDKINVTFEREEDMLLLLLNIFLHDFIQNYYFNDTMIEEIIRVLEKGGINITNLLLSDYKNILPNHDSNKNYDPSNYVEKEIIPGYYEKLYEESEKDESWKKSLDNENDVTIEKNETNEKMGGSSEENDYSKIIETSSKSPVFLSMFSNLLNYIVSFLDCYEITETCKENLTNTDQNNHINVVIYNNIQSTFTYFIDFLKNNESEDKNRSIIVSDLLSLLLDAYVKYHKENNSDFYDNSIEILHSEELFEYFIMNLIQYASSNELQKGGDSTQLEQVTESPDKLEVVDADVTQLEQAEPVDLEEAGEPQEDAPVEPVDVEEDEQPQEDAPIAEAEADTVQLEQAEPLDVEEAAQSQQDAPVAEPDKVQLEEAQQVDSQLEEAQQPGIETEEVKLEQKDKRNNLITVTSQGMFLKLGIWQNIFTKLKEQNIWNQDTNPAFDPSSLEIITRENLEYVYPSKENKNNELLIGEIILLKSFLLDVTPNIVTFANTLEKGLLENITKFYHNKQDNEDKQIISQLKDVKLTSSKNINNLYELLEENIIQIKSTNANTYLSSPKYKFIIDNDSNFLDQPLLEVYKELNRGIFCPCASTMNSNNNCSLSSNDYVKEIGSSNFTLSFKNEQKEMSYGGTVLFYNDDTRYQTNLNIDFRLIVDSDIAIINTNMLEAADADDLMTRVVYRSIVECMKNLIYQNIVLPEDDLTNLDNALLKEKMEMQHFWNLLKNTNNLNQLLAANVMQNMGNFLQECEGMLKWGGFINKFNTIMDTSNTFIVENEITPILRSVSQGSQIIPYDADGNALRLYVSKDISSAFRSIYLALNASEGINEHSMASYDKLFVSKGKVIHSNEEPSNKKMDDLEEFEPELEVEEKKVPEEVVEEEKETEEPISNLEPQLEAVEETKEEIPKELQEKGGKSSLKKKPSKRKYNTRNKKSNKKRNKKNTKGKNSKENKKGKSKTQKSKK
jgi:hypothetical protein